VDEKENEEENESYKLLTERWDSPIILTTMVLFLKYQKFCQGSFQRV
jgi:hypothetical protein